MVWRNLPTDALVPMARGFDALSVVATGENDLPVAWNSEDDTRERVEMKSLGRGADFIESLLRRIDAESPAS
jgi:hypothetical protein